MAEPEPKTVDGEPTPEPPLNPSDVARKVKRDASHRPLPEKAGAAARELYREVSGAYEAKQEREAGGRRKNKRRSA